MTTITQIPAVQKTVSPVDGRVYVERLLATPDAINEILRTARHAQVAWRNVSLAERAKVMSQFCDEFEKRAEDTTWKIAPEDIAETVALVLRLPERTTISRVEMRPSRPKK